VDLDPNYLFRVGMPANNITVVYIPPDANFLKALQ